MSNYAIAGVGYGKAFDNAGNLLFKTTTLTDSGFTTSTSLQEIRGGKSNSLQTIYNHSSKFEATLKDCLADLMYVALSVGGDVIAGANIYTTETIVTTVNNQITVTGTPKKFGDVGVIGWYNVSGSTTTEKISFTGSVASVTGVPIGTTVCVTYLIEDNSARVVEILSGFIPAEIHLVFTLPLFKAGIDTSNVSTSSQLGEWIVDVPRFKLDGALNLATTASSAVAIDIKGQALATVSMTGCDAKSIYATITEVIYGKDWTQNISKIAIADADVAVAVAGTSTLSVYAIYNDGTASKKLDNSLLSFVSDTPAKATAGLHTGVITGVATGTAIVTASITAKPTVNTTATVTVA